MYHIPVHNLCSFCAVSPEPATPSTSGAPKKPDDGKLCAFPVMCLLSKWRNANCVCPRSGFKLL